MSRPTIAVLEAMRPDNTKVYAEELDAECNGGRIEVGTFDSVENVLEDMRSRIDMSLEIKTLNLMLSKGHLETVAVYARLLQRVAHEKDLHSIRIYRQ